MDPSAQQQGQEESTTKSWGIKIGVLALAVMWLALMAASWASGAEPSSSPQSSDEYNFKWLDPDKKIYVLQNRRYLKADHAMVSLTGGPGWSNPYRNTLSLTPRFAYYFSEAFGIEFFYSATNNSENNTYKALVNTNTNVLPVIREIKGEFGGMLQWVPWYAKINVFNQILYFDWYFAGGAGTALTRTLTVTNGATTSVDESKFAAFVESGMIYHISEVFKVRMDVMGDYYRAPIYGTSGDNAWFANYKFELGIGAMF